MAEQFQDNFDFSRRRKLPDFEPYADGSVWGLKRGEDYQTTGSTFLAHARTWAQQHEMKLDSKIVPATDFEPEIVALRFTPEPPWSN